MTQKPSNVNSEISRIDANKHLMEAGCRFVLVHNGTKFPYTTKTPDKKQFQLVKNTLHAPPQTGNYGIYDSECIIVFDIESEQAIDWFDHWLNKHFAGEVPETHVTATASGGLHYRFICEPTLLPEAKQLHLKDVPKTDNKEEIEVFVGGTVFSEQHNEHAYTRQCLGHGSFVRENKHGEKGTYKVIQNARPAELPVEAHNDLIAAKQKKDEPKAENKFLELATQHYKTLQNKLGAKYRSNQYEMACPNCGLGQDRVRINKHGIHNRQECCTFNQMINHLVVLTNDTRWTENEEEKPTNEELTEEEVKAFKYIKDKFKINLKKSDIWLKPRPLDEFDDFDTDQEWLIHNMLLPNGLLIFTGSPGSGKSDQARHLAAAVVNGNTYLGRECKQGKVIAITPDEKVSNAKDGYKQLGLNDDSENFRIFPYSAGIFPIGQLVYMAAVEKPDLIIFDTLPKFVGLADNDKYMPVAQSTEQLSQIQQDWKFAILGITHDRKQEGTEAVHKIMGSQAWAGSADYALRFWLALKEKDGKRYYVEMAKLRTGEDIANKPTRTFLNNGVASLGQPEANTGTEKKAKEIIDYLEFIYPKSAPRSEIIEKVSGRVQNISNAIKWLTQEPAQIQRIINKKDARKSAYKLTYNPNNK